MERRKLLAVLGGSMTVAVAGCSGGDDSDNNTTDSGNGNGNGNPNNTTNGTGNGDDQPATFQLSTIRPQGTTVLVGTAVDVSITVTNAGDAEGTQTVELSIGSVTREEEITLGGGEEQTVTFEGIDTSELGPGEYEHTFSTDDDSFSGRLTVHEELAENEFIARSTEGIVWFGEPDKQTALEDALQLPPQEDAPDPVVVVGEVNDDGTWQSSTIDFPPLRGLPGLGDTVPRVETPNEPGFEGEINLTEGEERWTVEGQLRVIIPQEEEDLTLQFPLNATTEQSGDLSGEFDRTGSEASVTIVDNATPVNTSTGDDIIDGLLGLDGPAGESGNNWFRLTLDIEQLPVSNGE